MTLPTSENSEKCSVCRLPLTFPSSENWRSSTGEVFAVELSDQPYVIVTIDGNETLICESCYNKNCLEHFSIEDTAQIHYQFGLEYRQIGLHEKSVDALHRSLKHKIDPDVLAAIALAYGELGNHKLERAFYLQALKLNPSHTISKENLRNL